MKANNYQFTPEMKEISGFGGNYEATCRKMVTRGCEWFDNHPDSKPKQAELPNVFGLVMDKNKAAKELSEYITKGLDCTGAMHHAAINHIYAIQKMGWDAYKNEMIEGETNES